MSNLKFYTLRESEFFLIDDTTRQTMRDASRAGVTKETFGQNNNSGQRFEAMSMWADAARCYRRALEVHETWGQRCPAYGVNRRIYDDVSTRLERCLELSAS